MFSLSHKLSEHMPELTSIQECDEAFTHDLCILFKHSPTCMISRVAYSEVARFRKDEPEMPFVLVSVKRRRDVSLYIADKTGVHHESPQILVLKKGQVVAHTSHDGI